MKRSVWLVLLVMLGGWDLFHSPNPDVERGNQAFRDGKYDEALEAYGKAQTQMPNDPGVRFNRGVATYQKALNTPAGPGREQLLKDAQGHFQGATGAQDKSLRGQAHYNLGNTAYQQQDYERAVKEYKQSIKEDPSNQDARYNLELALRRREQKKQQQQQQQQGQGQQKQDQQQGQQGQPPPQDQQQQGQQQQQQQQGQQDQQQQQGQQDQQQQGQQDQQQQQGKDPQDPQQGQKDQQQQPGQQDPQQQQQPQGQQGDPQPQKPQPQDQQQGQPKDQQGEPKDPTDPKGEPKDSPGEPKQDPRTDPNAKDSSNPRGKPADPQRKTFGDAENKMDALERRSKDLKVQQQRGERRRGKVKDW